METMDSKIRSLHDEYDIALGKINENQQTIHTLKVLTYICCTYLYLLFMYAYCIVYLFYYLSSLHSTSARRNFFGFPKKVKFLATSIPSVATATSQSVVFDRFLDVRNVHGGENGNTFMVVN